MSIQALRPAGRVRATAAAVVIALAVAVAVLVTQVLSVSSPTVHPSVRPAVAQTDQRPSRFTRYVDGRSGSVTIIGRSGSKGPIGHW